MAFKELLGTGAVEHWSHGDTMDHNRNRTDTDWISTVIPPSDQSMARLWAALVSAVVEQASLHVRNARRVRRRRFDYCRYEGVGRRVSE